MQIILMSLSFYKGTLKIKPCLPPKGKHIEREDYLDVLCVGVNS